MSRRARFAHRLRVLRYLADPTAIKDTVAVVRTRGRSPLDLAEPWWPRAAIRYVDARLPAGARVFEFGGGGSTLWLVNRDAQVATVEHDAAWAKALQNRLGERVVEHVPSQPTGTAYSPVEDAYFDNYVASIIRHPDDTFDLVIVDGRARVTCIQAAMPKVRPGGMLLLDDSDRDRYAEAPMLLRAWDHWEGFGVKFGLEFLQTSVWTKPRLP